ncbi:MAG TPA: methyltransferase dimerization domain-containing protein, partial [Beijerinckiaceae bacterium]|nr:methyltransferase dimerization domain-containing protein [Beijerinckiaceae bacterium]
MEALRAIGGAPADVPSAETAAQRAAAAPHAQLIEMAIAIWRARALYAAAALGLADLLASGSLTTEQLAGATKTHPPSLYRLLRALAACGLLKEEKPQTFLLTPLGAALQSDAAGAAR